MAKVKQHLRVSRIYYILATVLGIILLPIFTFIVIIILLGLFGPDTLKKYPIIALVVFAAIILLYALYQYALNVRRLTDAGLKSDSIDILLLRSIPFGNLLYNLILFFRKSNRRQQSSKRK